MAMETSRLSTRIAGSTFLRGLLVATIAGVFLALVGAFQTTEASLIRRLLYWIPVMTIGGLWGYASGQVLERWLDLDERPWLMVLALTSVISGPVALLVWGATGVAFFGELLPLAALPQFLTPVAIITVTLSAINVFLARRQPVQTHAAATDAGPSRFLQRLPFKLRGAAIHAVQAEDHYLRIHTERGSDLILMRLSDALEELEGLEGSQTHRSWWVAKDAVTDVSRGDGRATLTLKDGITAPVSRRYARALREAGWY